MSVEIIAGDALETLRQMGSGSAACCVTSPPYFRIRDYEHPCQLGREETPDDYVSKLVEVFAEVRRCLRLDGSLWLNLGDSYAAGGHGVGGKLVAKRRQWGGADSRKGWRSPPPGYKQKDLLLIPYLLADRLRSDGWFLRRDIIWDKMVPTEPPRADRPSSAHEFVFLLTESKKSSVHDPGETWFNSSVWSVRPQPTFVDHSAVMQSEIARRCIVAGSLEGDTILDPFAGSGTTGLVADRLKRNAILVELNPE